MDFEFIEPWHAFLPRDGGHVVSVIGGGGKTSLLERLAEVLAAEGHRVIVTTTTRTEKLDWKGLAAIEWVDLVRADEAADGPIVFVGHLASGLRQDGKWHGLTPEEVDELGRLCPQHIVLVEADGSAGHPVKLHRDDEPPLPARTSLLIVVVGLSALGKQVGEVLHRHDRLPADWLAIDPATGTWRWEDYMTLLTHRRGYLDRLPEDVPVVLSFLQMDQCDDSIGLFGFLDQVSGRSGIPLVLLGDTSGAEPRLRLACPREDDDDLAP